MALIQMNFMSRSLLRTVPVQVILPADKFSLISGERMEEKAFKTLYLLHGIFGNDTDWISGTRIQRWAEAKNLAVVMPSGDNSFYVDQPQSGNMYGEFIGQELVEITRRIFPLSRNREDTFIGGLSMGGYGAVRNGLKYHDTFGYIVSLSGALHILENVEETGTRNIAYEESCFGDLKEAVQSDKNPRRLVEQIRKGIEAGEKTEFPHIFQACGTEDSLITVNRSYRDFFRDNGVDLTWYEGPGKHDWDFWDTCIQNALDWLPLEEETQGVNSGNVSA